MNELFQAVGVGVIIGGAMVASSAFVRFIRSTLTRLDQCELRLNQCERRIYEQSNK